VDKVRYVGEPVAVVVAENRYIAEDACELVAVDYEPLPSSGNFRRSLALGEEIYQGIEKNIMAHNTQRVGDVDAAFASAPHVLRETFDVRRGGGHSMEGRAVAARYDPTMDTFTVWDATQTPHQARDHLVHCFDLPADRIRVIAPPDVGGGFGPKGARYPEEVLVPWLARRIGRPVKFIEDRYEHFVSCCEEHNQEHHLEVGFDETGRLLALRDVFFADAGSHPSSLIIPTITGATVPGPYRIPNLHIEYTYVYTNTGPTTAVRGAGRPVGVFVMERMMDRVAEYLDLDPAEVRLRNLIQPEEFPYPVGLTFRDGSPLTYDSGNYPALLRTGLDLTGYDRQREIQREQRAAGGTTHRGIGISIAVEGVGLGPFEGASVRIESTGRVTAVIGAPPQGQGFQTTYAQVCAEALGVDVDDIDVITGDTGAIPYGVGTFASRVAANVAPAMHQAATEVREKLLASAAALLEIDPGDLVIVDREVRVRGSEVGISLARLAQISNAGQPGLTMPEGVRPGLNATAYFSPPRAGYSSSVQLCVVDVDAETGHVEILDYVVGHDCGKVINPLLVEGQITGGVAHGLSNALYEESVYSDDGVPLTTSYLEYPIPSAHEMPWLRMYSQETLSPLNPLGVKGAGEAGTLGVPAAIIGAIEDALQPMGVRVNCSPVSAGYIADLIADAASKGSDQP
jgi:carbon-monoxide dehydrogenase large subunit